MEDYGGLSTDKYRKPSIPIYKDDKIEVKIRNFLIDIIYRAGYRDVEMYMYEHLSFYIYTLTTKKMNICLTSYKYNIAIASLLLTIKMWSDHPRITYRLISDNFVYPRSSVKCTWFEKLVIESIGWRMLETTYDCFFLKTRDNMLMELKMSRSFTFVKPKFRIGSFDIGKENFAEFIEEYETEKVHALKEKYQLLPRKLKRKTSGPMTEEINEIIEGLFIAGRRVHIGVYDIRHTKEDILELETRENLFSHLSDFEELWETCDLVVIEQQFLKLGGRAGFKGSKFGTQANIDAIKLAECVFSWFKIKFPRKLVMFFPSTMKTKVFTDQPLPKKEQRKKFTEDKSYEVALMRNDEELLTLYQVKKELYKKRITEEKKEKYRKLFKDYDANMRYMGEKILERQKFNDFTDAEFQARAAVYKLFIAEF